MSNKPNTKTSKEIWSKKFLEIIYLVEKFVICIKSKTTKFRKSNMTI